MRSILMVVMLLMLALAGSSASAAEKELLFAVLPQRPPVAMYTSWRPFLDRLEKETGLTFKLKLYETMPQFEADLKRGEGDLAFSTPPHVVLARQSQQYRPLVRGSQQIAGVLFTRKDSSIKSLADLDNQDVAFIGSRNV